MEVKLKITGNNLINLSEMDFIEGNIGFYKISFEFSPEWEGLIKHIVITSKSGTFDDAIADDVYELPAVEDGIVHIGVWGEDTSAKTRISTNMIYIKVKPGAYSEELFPEMDAYAWSVYHKLVLSYAERAEGASEIAKESAEKAADSETNAAQTLDTCDQAARDAEAARDVAFEKAAETEKLASRASVSEEIASQALADLLNMINSGDIILAQGGKLPLSSIPATATQEIYVVENEAELTSLVAQRGDLAELVETVNGERTITKTWQCLGDSSKRENWVVWGTSYAVSAGNAEHSNTSTNASMINGHRLVEMSEAEFENAVKDNNTYYLVY